MIILTSIFNPSTTTGAILCGVVGSIVASIIVSFFTAKIVTKKTLTKNNENASAFGIKNKVNFKSNNRNQ